MTLRLSPTPACNICKPYYHMRLPQHAAAVAKKAARATAEQVHAVLNSPPQQQQAPLRSPPTVTLQEAAAFGRGLAGHS